MARYGDFRAVSVPSGTGSFKSALSAMVSIGALR